jgi:hypothetical protein
LIIITDPAEVRARQRRLKEALYISLPEEEEAEYKRLCGRFARPVNLNLQE